ncbi:MAG: glycosyltransferase family 2 protein [Desulfobacterales bacterium]
MTQNPPRVCLGMPVYNQVQALCEALDALLRQSYGDFRLVALDDSTDPEPGRILKEAAERDPRIHYAANPQRRGLIDNWRACVQAAGDAEFFAWVSDHDLHEPRWLESLVRILEEHPTAVLAYPLTGHLEADGGPRKKKKVHRFTTLGLPPRQRVQAVCRQAKGFGKMVYGLFRLEALKQAGVLRRLLTPDVILLLELSLFGDFVQVPEVLWYRRKTADFSVQRQRKALFGADVPWYAHLPWPLVNSAALLWNRSLRRDAGPWSRRLLGLNLAAFYFTRWIGKYGEGSWIGSYHEWRHGKKPWMKRIKKRLRSRNAET